MGDRKFLRSQTPYHGGAILMAEQASIADPDLKHLAESIITSQQAEIEDMKRKLEFE